MSVAGVGRAFRLGERLERGEAEVLEAVRSPAAWAAALGGSWEGDRWRWSRPRAGSAIVAFLPTPRGVSVTVTGDAVTGSAELSVVSDATGCTVVADVRVAFASVVPGAWWHELQREAAPRWLRALSAGARAGTGPAAD